MPASVLGRAAAFDQPRVLELVEEADEVGAVQAQRLGEVRLAALSELAEDREREQVPGAEAESVELGLHRRPQPPCQVPEQRRRELQRWLDDREIGHRQQRVARCADN